MAYRAKAETKPDKLQPPQAVEVERDLLGAILKDADAINRVVEIIDDPQTFYSPRHRTIFEAVLELYRKAQPCDITTVANEMARKGVLDKMGGRVYLVDLIEQVATTSNVGSYAEIILEKYTMRALISASNEISHSCYQGDQPVDDLLDQAESNIFDISQKRLRTGFVPISGLVGETFERINEFQSEGTGFGLMTGYTNLDALTNGLHNGDLVIVAGRPSMGKTSFALNVMHHIAVEHSIPVGFFSIEMSNESLVLRMMSTAAKVSQTRVRRQGKLTERELGALSKSMNKLGRAEIYLDDSASLSLLEMRAKARRLKAQHNIGMIVVDYIQLMHVGGRVENRQQEIAQISRGMKALAKELDIPVMGISQLSRLVEQRGGDKRPQLSDLRESGAIEQDADLVMFVYRPEAYLNREDRDDPKNEPLRNKAEIIIAKQRNGETGTAELVFLKEFTRFENSDRVHRELPAGAQPVSGGDQPF